MNMSSLGRHRGISSDGSPVFHEIGICGGTSSLAAARARQMAKQREINAATSRKIRSEDYLRNLQDDEEREKQDAKDRARARASQMEEDRMDHLAARADRLRLRNEPDPSEKRIMADAAGQSSTDTPYAVLKARRRQEQSRRQINQLQEQMSSDLARARAVLHEERKRDDLQLTRDISKSYETARAMSNFAGARPSSIDRREAIGGSAAASSSSGTRHRRLLDLEEDWHSPSRRRTTTDDRFSDLTYSRANGVHNEIGNSSIRSAGTTSLRNSTAGSSSSRTSKEVHWSMDE